MKKPFYRKLLLAGLLVSTAAAIACAQDTVPALQQPASVDHRQLDHRQAPLDTPTPRQLPEPPEVELPPSVGEGVNPRIQEELFEGLIPVDDEPLPPLEEELWLHGGSYLYEPEGDGLNWPGSDECAHDDLLRLPEYLREPKPLTGARQFLGADPIVLNSRWRWFGCHGYVWEPRFVGHGSYEIFGFAREENGRRQDVLGHQLRVDLDLRLTGTERFHVQYRPLGRENTGGSYYQLSDPERYFDNSTGAPDRYWFEAELHSLVGAGFDPLASLDYGLTVGRVPLQLHNDLLINDELAAVIVNKNSLIFGEVSNLNVQGIFGFNDVSTDAAGGADLFAVHAAIDHARRFYEATYAFVDSQAGSGRDTHYAALSRTAMEGPMTISARLLLKWGDHAGSGDGQLFVLEAQRQRLLDQGPCGIEQAVCYANTFFATRGWNSIARGNFNRLGIAFEADPLVRIAALPPSDNVWGVSCGVQLFRCHEDESLIPEIAFEDRDGVPAVAGSLRWLRKTGPRSFLEAAGLISVSDDPARDREGIVLSHSVLF